MFKWLLDRANETDTVHATVDYFSQVKNYYYYFVFTYELCLFTVAYLMTTWEL